MVFKWLALFYRRILTIGYGGCLPGVSKQQTVVPVNDRFALGVFKINPNFIGKLLLKNTEFPNKR